VELVDTHCHLYWDSFGDLDAVVINAKNAGVTRMIVPGTDIDSSLAAMRLAEKYGAIYAAVGVHPNDIMTNGMPLQESLRRLKSLAGHEKVVAIGEIGLDYYWEKTPHNVQHEWLGAQLTLASELRMPVILHNRESTADILRLLAIWRDRYPDTPNPGVLHSFSGTWTDAQVALDMGFHLGFTGPITYKKADDMREVAQMTPESRILIETDSPFLAPHPKRGERNEPAFVAYVNEKLANLRGWSVEEAATITTANAVDLFRLT